MILKNLKFRMNRKLIGHIHVIMADAGLGKRIIQSRLECEAAMPKSYGGDVRVLVYNTRQFAALPPARILDIILDVLRLNPSAHAFVITGDEAVASCMWYYGADVRGVIAYAPTKKGAELAIANLGDVLASVSNPEEMAEQIRASDYTAFAIALEEASVGIIKWANSQKSACSGLDDIIFDSTDLIHNLSSN